MSQQHYCRNKHSTEHSTKAGPGSCYNGYHSHVEMAEPGLFCQDADVPKEILLLINLSRFPESVLRGVWSTFPTKKNPNQPNLSWTTRFPSFCFPTGTVHLHEWPASSLSSSWASSFPWPFSNPNGAADLLPPFPHLSLLQLQLPCSRHTACLLSHTTCFSFQD